MVKPKNREWEQIEKNLPIWLTKLENCHPIIKVEFQQIKKEIRGIYVFYENGKPLYVGRSNRIRRRLYEHSRPSSSKKQAHFAVKLEKELPEKSFEKQKKRIEKMKVKYVEIPDSPDSVEQAIFEIYVHLKLHTKYNDFNNN